MCNKKLAEKIFALGALVFALCASADAPMCPLNFPSGPIVAYDDRFNQGWDSAGSFGVNIAETDANNPLLLPPSGQNGSASVKVEFSAPWKGIQFHRPNLNTSGRNMLAFRVRKEHVNGDIFVGIWKTSFSDVETYVRVSSYLVLPNQTPVFTANTWWTVLIPLSALGAEGVPIDGIVFQDEVAGTAYFEDVALVSGLSLAFPLHNGTTPYTANIASVFDHTMKDTYTKDTDGIVTAYTGEKGDGAGYSSDPTCKKQASGLPFVVNSHYTGASSCGGPTYLSYDGHPGIDYPVPLSTPIYASATGVVVSSECSASSCSGFGALKIKLPNNYQTWYLHLSQQVAGLAVGSSVNKGDLIGYSGNTAPYVVGYHLHFELRNPQNIPLDPYGWGGNYSDPYSDYHPVINIRQWE